MTAQVGAPPLAAGPRDAFGWRDALTLLGLLALALGPVLPDRQAVLGGAGGVVLLSALASGVPGSRFSRVAAAVAGALCLYWGLAREWFVWPAYLLAPLAAAGLLAWAAGFGGDLRAALAKGRLARTEWVLIGGIACVSALALVAWTVLLKPDLSRQIALLPAWPLPALVGAGLAFSVINALLEEVVWRGILQTWLHAIVGPALAVVIQALSFGASHYGGFPSGFAGMGLAFIYGLMIGALALRSRGLLAPIIAHIAADAVIFAVLASSA